MLAVQPVISSFFTSLFTMMLGFVALSSFSARDARAGGLDVEVQTIYAKDQGEHFDAKLEPLREELQSTFELYSHFEHIETRNFSIKLNESHALTLPDTEKTELELTYNGPSAEDNTLLRLGLALKGKLSTEVEAPQGATFFQAGLFYRDGILILAIRAELVQ